MVDKIKVTIEIIVHATEDVDRILESFFKLFEIKEEEFSRQELTGHFENPITLLSTKIIKKEARNLVKKIVSKIPQDQMEELIGNIENRIQNSTLHMRLGKQDLLKGSVLLKDKDAIKLRIFIPAYSKKDVVRNYVELLKDGS